jgi:hypothetical protein
MPMMTKDEVIRLCQINPDVAQLRVGPSYLEESQSALARIYM